MNHATRKHDDLRVQDVSERAQAGTQRKAGVMDDLGRLCVARTAQVVHIATDRRTAGVDATKALIVHTTNGSARSNRLQMAGTPAGAGNTGGSRALDVAHMASSTMETLHHAAVLDICATDARTDAKTQDGELALADAPVGLAQSMSLHVAYNGNGKTEVLAQARPQLNTGPAGHDLVGIRDGARLGIDDAGGTDTDAKDLDIGIRLESSLDGRLDTLEDGLAALLGLGGNLGLKTGWGTLPSAGYSMMAVAILVPPISTEQTYLFSMSLSLGDKKQLQEMRRQASRHSAEKVFQVPEIAKKPCDH